MSGQVRKFNFTKYYEQLKEMPEPIMASDLPQVKLDLRGIRDYAKKKGVSIANLSKEEKKLFMIPY